MVTSLIAKNITLYIRRHIIQENKKQGFQQGLVVYP